jgi:hypothetical protein
MQPDHEPFAAVGVVGVQPDIGRLFVTARISRISAVDLFGIRPVVRRKIGLRPAVDASVRLT